jgi:transcriptional regulator with XRE-family HTH domain
MEAAMASQSVFGKLVLDRRNALKLTQQQVGEKIGIAQSYFSEIEKGRRPINLEKIPALAVALELTEEDLRAALRCDDKEGDSRNDVDVLSEDLAFLQEVVAKLNGKMPYSLMTDLMEQRLRHRK